jgi:hypothetical protein
MNEYDVKRLARVFAIQAEIEGMKIANVMAIDRGFTPPHGEGSFQEKAFQLESLAYMHNEQL